MRVEVFQRFRRIVATLIAVVGFVLSLQGASGQDAATTRPAANAPTTFVVFADRPMAGDEWTALFEAVKRSATAEKLNGADRTGADKAGVDQTGANKTGADATVELVRGDAMRPGLLAANPIVVYLHGDCTLEPLPRRIAYSVPLGWVRRENGQIAPFIHVDCTRIGQVLGVQARGLDKQARDRMMAGAVARVLEHEWIHVARQSAEHGRNGITKASFGVADLLGETETHAARR